MSVEDSRKVREARSVALERAYVHDVYDQVPSHCHQNRQEHETWPKVLQFLGQLEPGALVADVGCGKGQYLSVNRRIFPVGVDRCAKLCAMSRNNNNEVMVSDNILLPFRDESMDAVVSVAVVHHFATTERRVDAIRELARVLRVGGKLLITVWSMEERSRKFESQDVLVPWQPSESNWKKDTKDNQDHHALATSGNSQDRFVEQSGTRQYAGLSVSSRPPSVSLQPPSPTMEESIDLAASSTLSLSSSDLSSPSGSCYSFVKRALQVAPDGKQQKLTNGRRNSSHQWTSNVSSDQRIFVASGEDALSRGHKSSIKRLFAGRDHRHFSSQESLDSWHETTIELRHLEPEDPTLLEIPFPVTSRSAIPTESKSKSRSLTNLLQSTSYPSLLSSTLEALNLRLSSHTEVGKTDNCLDASSSFWRFKINSPVSSVVQEPKATTLLGDDSLINLRQTSVNCDSFHTCDASEEFNLGIHPPTRKRPTLQKQKAAEVYEDTDKHKDRATHMSETETVITNSNTLANAVEAKCQLPRSCSVTKQKSLNDDLICIDRMVQMEKLKQGIQKQSSLNESMVYGHAEKKRDTLKDYLLKHQFPTLETIKEGFRNLRTASLDRFHKEKEQSSNLKTDFIQLLQQWRSDLTLSKESDEMAKKKTELIHQRMSSISSESDTKLRESSLQNTSTDVDIFCKLEKGKHFLCKEYIEKKVSCDESSDSSKENSFQSDTSLDSEDSCISVIFIPKPGQINAQGEKEHNRSVSSESSEGSEKQLSPKSPQSVQSPKSPATHLNSSIYLEPKFVLNAGPKIGVHKIAAWTEFSSETKENKTTESSAFPLFSKCDNEMLPKSGEAQLHDSLSIVKHSSNSSSSIDRTVSTIGSKINVESSQLNGANVSSPASIPFRKFSQKGEQTLSNINVAFSKYPKPLSSLLLGENVEIIHKPRGNSGSKGVHIVRKNLPRLLTFEVFNPETDDLDSDSSASSSPNSGSSVIERGWPTEKDIEELEKEIKRCEEETKQSPPIDESMANVDSCLEIPKMSLVDPVHRMDTINEEGITGEQSGIVSFRSNTLASKSSSEGHVVDLTNRPSVFTEKLKFSSSERNLVDANESHPTTSGYVQESRNEAVVDQKTFRSDSFGKKLPTQQNDGSFFKAKANNKSFTTIFPSSKMPRVTTERTVTAIDPKCMTELAIKPMTESLKVITEISSSQMDRSKINSTKISTTSSAVVYPSNVHKLTNYNLINQYQSSKTVSCEPCHKRIGKTVGNPHSVSMVVREKEIEDHLSSRFFKGTSPADQIPFTNQLDANQVTCQVKCQVTCHSITPKMSSCKVTTIAAHKSCDYKYPKDISINSATAKERSCRKSKQMTRSSRQNTNTEEASKPVCQICVGEKEKSHRRGQHLFRLDLLNQRSSEHQSPEHSSSVKRGKFKHQVSLDSAKGQTPSKAWHFSRSGSLDLDTKHRVQLEGSFGSDASLSTSQDSLCSDTGGGYPTLHNYYHMFKQGELDNLIDKYVHNLHILSSYYDHANWCIVAEKVQVWTI